MTLHDDSPECERQKKKLLGRMNALKSTLSAKEYIEECRLQCVQEGLEFDVVRASVWRDMVLGADRGALHVVPYLVETVIATDLASYTASAAEQETGDAGRAGDTAMKESDVHDGAGEEEEGGGTSTADSTKNRTSSTSSSSSVVLRRVRQPASGSSFASVHGMTDTTGNSPTHSPKTSSAAPSEGRRVVQRLPRPNRRSSVEPTAAESLEREGSDVYSPVRRRALSQKSLRVKGESAAAAAAAAVFPSSIAGAHHDVDGRDSAAEGARTSHSPTIDRGGTNGLSVDTSTGGGLPASHNNASLFPPFRAAHVAPRPAVYRLPENCQARVVEADILRSLWTLYPDTVEREKRRKQLKVMLLRILAHNKTRFYYQGLHELMGYVMYVLSPHAPIEIVVSVCESLLRTRWHTFSEKKLTHSEGMLYAMHALIAESDPALAAALEECGVAPESHYAVSWIITWYTHCVTDTKVLGRIFDYCIAPPDELGVVFVTAAFIIGEKQRILDTIMAVKLASEDMGVDGDSLVLMAQVYAQLTELPRVYLNTMPLGEVNKLLQRATALREQYLDVVKEQQQNFMKGDVCKLGMLANQRTRNAALRLLWALLPREWRNPAKQRNVQRVVLLASVALVSVIAAASAKWSWNGLGNGGGIGGVLP